MVSATQQMMFEVMSSIPIHQLNARCLKRLAETNLINAGMKKLSETTASDKSENEYFLVVLTDGAFNGTFDTDKPEVKVQKAEATLSKYLNKYSSFQMLYLAFSAGAVDVSGSQLLNSYGDFHAYKAATPTDIAATMQEVANRITGRYSLSASDYTLSGNKVTLNLDKVGFSLRSISVMLQNSNARLQSASYKGAALNIQQGVTISADTELGIKDGYSAVLKQASTSAVFSGGKVELTFDEITAADMKNFSVLLEPALTLKPVLSADVNGKRTEIDAAYVNSHMVGKDKIYVSYEIFEEGSGNQVSLDEIFGTVAASVAYDGKKYAVNEAIPLVTGAGEVSVSVSVMNGTYNLYASLPLVVLVQPTYFRIEAGTPTVLGGNPAVTETVFSIYDNNTLIGSNAALEAYSPIVVAKNEKGDSLPVSVRRENGKLIAKLDVTGQLFGNYILEASVVSPDGNPRSLSVKVPFYPGDVSLKTEGETTHSMTLHGLLSNQNGYTFVLSADGQTMEFSNSMVSYKVTVGSTDVTAFATVDGDRLTFVPTKEALGALGDAAADHKVTVTVTVPVSASQSKTVSASGTLSLTNTVFEVVTVEKNQGGVDRFALGKNQTSAYFRILRDGAYLNEEELAAAIEDGTFSIGEDYVKMGFLVPLSHELTVETVDGIATIRCRMVSDQAGIFSFFTSMLVGGDRDIHAAYGSVGADAPVPFENPGLFPYILRFLVIIAIVYMIIFIAFTFNSDRVSRLPKGTLVEIELEKRTASSYRVQGINDYKHIGGFPRCLMMKRIIPIVGLMRQTQTTPFGDGTVVAGDNLCITLPDGGNVTTYRMDQKSSQILMQAVQNAYANNQEVSTMDFDGVNVILKANQKKHARDEAATHYPFSMGELLVVSEYGKYMTVLTFVPGN